MTELEFDKQYEKWSAFKSDKSLMQAMFNVYGFSEYECFLSEGYTHEAACDSVMDNIQDTKQGK